MPTLLVDSVQLVANLLRSWNASQLVAWAWRLVLRLRLHVLDVYPAHASWTLDHPHRALADVGRLDDEPQLGLIRDAVYAGDPLATFVALSLTDVGHVVPQWCTRGPQLLAQLVAAHCHQQVPPRFFLYLYFHFFLLSNWFDSNFTIGTAGMDRFPQINVPEP